MTQHPSTLDEPAVRELIARSLSHEPGFDVAQGDALDAAVAIGRRRRVRAQTSRGLALVAVAATVAGGVALVRLPISTSARDVGAGSGGSVTSTVDAAPSAVPSVDGGSAEVPQPKASSSGVVTPTPIPSVSADAAPGVTLRTSEEAAAHLEALVRDLAATAHGTVTSLEHQQQPVMNGHETYQQSVVVAHVTSSGGAFDLSASVMLLGGFDAATWTSACSPSTVDAKPCTVVDASTYDVMTSADYSANPGQRGRTTAQYVAAVPDGSTLEVDIDNYTEQSGAKKVGPSWKHAGLGYAALHESAAANDLLR